MKILRTKASEGGFGEVLEMSESDIIALLLTADDLIGFIVYSKEGYSTKKYGEYVLEIKDYDTYVE